jgi:hypothetical protein
MITMEDKEKHEFLNPEDWQGFTRYLSETNRFILSDYWEKFVDTIIGTAHKRVKTLEKGKTLVRARIGTSWVEFDDGDEQPYPISPHEMGPPPKHLASAGRSNSEGIPYLYLATQVETAVAEVRPWIGAEVTIGFFKILSDLSIVDTSDDKPKNTLSLYEFVNMDKEDFDIRRKPNHGYTSVEKEEYIWGDINSAFSRPISPNEPLLKYLPTQFVSEKLKIEGYDGVAYKSSLNEKGYNIALFDPLKAKCTGCRMYEIKKMTYDFEESGNAISLSDDDKVLYPRIVAYKALDDSKREKKDPNKLKSNNFANSADAEKPRG